MRTSKKHVGAYSKRRRYFLFNQSELVRMKDGSFYTRKSTMPVARHYDDSGENRVPASLHYEFNRRSLKKDPLQCLVFQVDTQDKAKTAKLMAVASSRAARQSRGAGAKIGG